MRLLLAVLITLAFVREVPAQQLRIRLLTGTGDPVQGATVSVLRSSDNSAARFGATDRDGRVFFSDVGIGSYVVRTEIIGFEPAQVRLTLQSDTAIDIRLREAP